MGLFESEADGGEHAIGLRGAVDRSCRQRHLRQESGDFKPWPARLVDDPLIFNDNKFCCYFILLALSSKGCLIELDLW